MTTAVKLASLVDSSGNVSIASGTANGVAYLNGSKVLTTGSALTFDGTNLGVGNASPYFNFDVVTSMSAGGARIQNSTSSSARLYLVNSTSSSTTSNSVFGIGDALAFGANGSEQMRLTSTGLGIGTNSPQAKLHVGGESVIIDRSGGDPYLTFYTSGSANNVSVYGGASTGFRVFTGGSERLRIDSGGNVGIGTSSPLTKLDVTGSGTATTNLGITIHGTDNAAWGQYLQFRRNGSNSLIIGDAGAIYGSGGGNTVYYSYGTYYQSWVTNAAERMRIDSSGNVGIGTSSPSQKLTVNGNILSNAWMGASNTSAPAVDAAVYRPADGTLGFVTNTAERMRIDTGGRVTMPYQPAFYGGRSGGDVAANTSYVMNVATVNNGNHFNTSTGLFTCPVAGRYLVTFSVMTQANFSGSLDMFAVTKNGTGYTANYLTSNGQTYQRVAGSIILECAANDTIGYTTKQVAMYGGSPSHCYGTICLLG